MITALLLGLVRTILSLFWNILTGLFSSIFGDFNTYITTIANSSITQFAVGLIDLVWGWSWFTQTILLSLSVMGMVKLAKYLIGLLTKG